MSGSPPTLDDRALNRALLARQQLLTRSAAPTIETIERLVGLQAQVPSNPYVALWSRVEGFDPQEVGALVQDGHVVRTALMRATIHLVSAADHRVIHPVTAPVLAQTFRTQFQRDLDLTSVPAIVDEGVALLREGPRTRAEITKHLAATRPDVDPLVLGLAVHYHLPLVQVPPRGVWGRTGVARWALADDVMVSSAPADVDALVLRYLAAFGPATAADVRTWSGLTGLRDVIERLRPRLRTFRDTRGRELLDVPDGLLPDPASPAPPRFIPEYDNVGLSHADRARIISSLMPAPPMPRGGHIGTVLVDGFARAWWQVKLDDDVATLTIERFTPSPDDPADTREAVEVEGEGLLALLAPDAVRRQVRFVPAS